VLKTQICVTRLQCVKIEKSGGNSSKKPKLFVGCRDDEDGDGGDEDEDKPKLHLFFHLHVDFSIHLTL
jgi:hypothetical protein